MSDSTLFQPPDITLRKNQGLTHDEDFTLEQPFERYSAQDHAVWKTLYLRQIDILKNRACEEYLAGLTRLNLDEYGIPRLAHLNKILKSTTGWQLVAVHGLIPDAVFFEHLANRRFPVTWWIREVNQLDYLQEPDLFHDLFGHVPLLINPVFADYLQAYGQGGLKADSMHALPMLARLYWYTVEFGLINTPAGLRIYGSGILSSRTESIYCLENPKPHRIQFDLLRIMRTRYRIDTFQETYFVINSFDELFKATEADFAPYYAQLAHQGEIAANAIVPYDVVI